MAPSCPPSLHGPSRLSRASGAIPPALARNDAQGTLFTEEEFQALMRGQCEPPSFSEDELYPPLQFTEDDDAGLQAPPPSTLDDLLQEPLSDEDVESLATLFCEEEIQALWAALAQQTSTRFSGPRSDDDQAGKKTKSPPWPSCIEDDDDDNEEADEPSSPDNQAGKKRKSPPWPSCIEDDDDDDEADEPPSPPPPPIKKTRTESRRSRHADAAHAAWHRRQLREWHNTIATRILRRRFDAPELSGGQTALRCQCLELVLADDDPRGGGMCALHQDVQPAARAWMSGQGGHVPLVGGPGEVLVPTVAAGSSKAEVMQYARWRRSVWMPTRFYMQRAAEQGMELAAPAHRQPDDDWI